MSWRWTRSVIICNPAARVTLGVFHKRMVLFECTRQWYQVVQLGEGQVGQVRWTGVHQGTDLCCALVVVDRAHAPAKPLPQLA